MNSGDDLWNLAFSNVGRSGGESRDGDDVAQAIQAISGIAATSRRSNNVTGEWQLTISESKSVLIVAGGYVPQQGAQAIFPGGTTANGPITIYPQYPYVLPSHRIPGRRAWPLPGTLPVWRVDGRH
jgi:hypothetical protein